MDGLLAAYGRAIAMNRGPISAARSQACAATGADGRAQGGPGVNESGARRATSPVQKLIEYALDEHRPNSTTKAHTRPRGLIVELPGERKLKTETMLTVGEHSVRVEAFVCRRPDENHEAVYRFMLKRNRRLYGVAYTLDNIGDVYLVGHIALETVSVEEIDRVLGQVLDAVESDFNRLLALGFPPRSARNGHGAWQGANRCRIFALSSTSSRRAEGGSEERDAESPVRDFVSWEMPPRSCWSATARASGTR